MKTTTPTPPPHCTVDPEDRLGLGRCWPPGAPPGDIGY
ncbi:(2Fe-2S)-binding protein, partial [Klebsiella pneumoniae subsp. pneumoniae]